MSEKTPSERLRESLDERGIEWKSEINCDTYWYGQDRTFYKFTEYNDGTTSFSTCQWNLTPRQVLTTPVAATLGRTAKRVRVPYQSHVALGHYECGACGQTVDVADRYCRKCGTRLVDE